MTSIDPQANTGPKTSQTKFGLVAPSKTEEGAFLAFMTATTPAIPPGMMHAPGTPERGIAQAPFDPSQSDDLPGNAAFPLADHGDGSRNLGLAMHRALHAANPDGLQTVQPVPAVGKPDEGPLPSGPIARPSSGPAEMLIAQAPTKPNGPGSQEAPNSAGQRQDSIAPHSPEKEQRLPEATTQSVQTDTNGLPIIHALSRPQEIVRNVVPAPVVMQEPALDFQPRNSEAIRFSRAGGADGPPEAWPVDTQTQSIFGPEMAPMRGNAPQERAEEAIALPKPAQGMAFFAPPEMKHPAPLQHRSNLAPPHSQADSPALVQTGQAALPPPARPASQSPYHDANHGIDTSNTVKATVHNPSEPAIAPADIAQAGFPPQKVALRNHALPPENPANGIAVVKHLATEPNAPILVPALSQKAVPETAAKAKLLGTLPPQAQGDVAHRSAIRSEPPLATLLGQNTPAETRALPNSTSEPPFPPHQGAKPPYSDKATVASRPSPVFSVFSTQATDNDPGPDLSVATPRHLSEVAGLMATQPLASTTTAQALGPPMQHQPIPISAIATIVKDQAAPGKTKTIELTLAPEELGRIRLLLQPDGDKMRIVVQAERPETMDLLRRNAEVFSSELRQSGFANSSFSFGGWGEPPPKFAKSQKDGDLFPATTMQTAAPPAPINAPRPSAGLDLRV